MTEIMQNDADRLEADLLFQAGLSKAEIARRLGRSRSTVDGWLDPERAEKQKERRKRYQRPCPQCGTPMEGSGGFKSSPKLCSDCAHTAQHENRYWTQETIIEAIQRWALSHDGQPPAASMWLRKTPKGIPPVACVMREFGTWNKGIEAAGFTPTPTGCYDRTGSKGISVLQEDILDSLRIHGPQTLPELIRRLHSRTHSTYTATLRLSRRGLIKRSGRGGKGHPFVWEVS